MIFCDPAVTMSNNLLLIFVCVPHQLKINITYVIRLIKCPFKKKVKNQKHPWGPTWTPLGILRYKCGMLLFLLFLGSERCKFEKWPANNAQKIPLFRCWMSVI